MKISAINPILLFFLIALVCACNSGKGKMNPDVMKEEIASTEKEFEQAAKEKGIAEAFYDFADDRAVILRANDTLITGKENIKKYYQDAKFKNAVVTWTPSFVEVSADGSLGYTFGNYAWKNVDKTGKVTAFKGVFHTVWKRQPDGKWKYVWD
jgi:ketosteroid isomerase-like protein